MTGPGPSLRERKKLRTHQRLVESAIALFGEYGFDAVTIEQLVAEVEVSPRTFFRVFDSKEDVVLAPEQHFWRTFSATIEVVAVDDPVITTLEHVLLSTVDEMHDQWAKQFQASRRIADQTPALTARSLRFCADMTAEIATTLGRRTGVAPADLRLRLALELMLAVWHTAIADWAITDAADTEWLSQLVRDGFATLPAVLGMPAE